MKKLDKYFNKNVGVLGLGKSGMATIKFLSNSKANIYAFDDFSEQPKNSKNFIWKHYLNWEWSSLLCVIISPGIKICGKKNLR